MEGVNAYRIAGEGLTETVLSNESSAPKWACRSPNLEHDTRVLSSSVPVSSVKGHSKKVKSANQERRSQQEPHQPAPGLGLPSPQDYEETPFVPLSPRVCGLAVAAHPDEHRRRHWRLRCRRLPRAHMMERPSGLDESRREAPSLSSLLW